MKPSSQVKALGDQPAAGEFGVERRIVVGLPIGRTAVARDVDFDAAPRTGLPQATDVKGVIGIEKQAFQAQFGCFEQFAQLGKDALPLKRVVLVASLGRGHGQRQALVIGQKQGVSSAPRLAGLIADGPPAVLGQRVAALELDAGQVQGAPVQP